MFTLLFTTRCECSRSVPSLVKPGNVVFAIFTLLVVQGLPVSNSGQKPYVKVSPEQPRGEAHCCEGASKHPSNLNILIAINKLNRSQFSSRLVILQEASNHARKRSWRFRCDGNSHLAGVIHTAHCCVKRSSIA